MSFDEQPEESYDDYERALYEAVQETNRLKAQVNELQAVAQSARMSFAASLARRVQLVIDGRREAFALPLRRDLLPEERELRDEFIGVLERLRDGCDGASSVPDDIDVVEMVAAECHRQWAGWTKHFLEKMGGPIGGILTLEIDWAERWQRQIDTPYAGLSEEERESDRREARKILAALGAGAKHVHGDLCGRDCRL